MIKGAGGAEVTEANEAVFNALVKPALDALKDEAGVVQLALDLELAAAQTYAFAGGALSQPALRSTIMTIGGVEARHAAVLAVVAQAKAPKPTSSPTVGPSSPATTPSRASTAPSSRRSPVRLRQAVDRSLRADRSQLRVRAHAARGWRDGESARWPRRGLTSSRKVGAPKSRVLVRARAG